MASRHPLWLLSLIVLGALPFVEDRVGADETTSRIIGNPVVLDSSIQGQFGGHTFGYLVEGESGVFWSARRYVPGREAGLGPMLVGQYPKLSADLPIAVSTLAVEGAFNHNTPHLIRTPDGHIHVFLTSDHHTQRSNYNRSTLHYFRSARPEDIRTLVDRTELIRFDGRTKFSDFHARLNVGITPDGNRVALVILAISPDGSVAFNTPVLFAGRRDGPDFRFDPPVAYAEPMGLFYPQVAASEDSIVVVAQVFDEKNHCHTRLMHLDWSGKLIHREDFPEPTVNAYAPEDLRVMDDRNERLLLCAHDWNRGFDLWEYDVRARRIERLRSVNFGEGQTPGHLKCLLDGSGRFLVVGAPREAAYAYRGSLQDDTPVVVEILREPPSPKQIGFRTNYYICVPNRIYGSLEPAESFYVAGDFANASWDSKAAGPFSWLLWRLRLARR